MYTPIQLDKARNLRYGMVAMDQIEKRLKIKSIADLDISAVSMEQMAIIVWAGLYREDKDLTPERVMELIDDYSDLGTVMEVITVAFTESFAKNNKAAVN